MLDLLDLVEPNVLIDMEKSFSELFGFNVAFTGLKSKPIEERRYDPGTTCEMVQKSPDGEKNCYLSDEAAGKEAIKEDKPLMYKCHCLCSNFVIPIRVGNDCIGFIYSGQFFVYPPEQKTDQQWKILRAKYNIAENMPEAEWEKKKHEIIKSECDELDGLLHFFRNLNPDKKYDFIKGNFFHSLEEPPTEKELEGIAEKNTLVHKKNEFVRIFKNNSHPDKPNNRVKDIREIVKNMKILSTVADALSDECNTKYALKTYFETCEVANRVIHPTSLLYRKAQKEIYCDLESLAGKMKPFLGKTREASQERVSLANEIDVLAVQIYQKILRLERTRTLRWARLLHVACGIGVSKDWLHSPHGEGERSVVSARELKDDRKMQIQTQYKHQKEIRGKFTFRSILSLWMGTGIVSIVITILKLVGWV